MRSKSTIKKSLIVIAFSFLVALLLVVQPFKVKAAESLTLNMVQSSKVVKLGKKKEVVLDVKFINNHSTLFTVDLNISFDSSRFDYVQNSLEKNNSFSSLEVVSDDTVDNLETIKITGFSFDGISETSGTLFSVKLVSLKGEANTAITFDITNIAIYDEVTGAIYGQPNIGLSTVNFTKSSIPWWVWLVIVLALILAIGGGYVFHLFLPDTLGKAYGATKKFAVETAKKTAELANRVFNRRPVAPKMKPSNPSNAVKPVQPVAAQPVKKVEPVKPSTPDNRPDQLKPTNVTTGVPLNVTTIKTRVVNPDGSVTTVTKKVANPVNLNGTENNNK